MGIHRHRRVVTSIRALALGALYFVSGSANAVAQASYYNVDAGRPTRIEDATPAARYELELQLAPARVERMGSGVKRWRLEPKLAYGVAPFTELEIRAPYLIVDVPDADKIRQGWGGVAIGAMHALTIERGLWPALAVAGEWLAPVGKLGADVGSYSAKGIVTRTFPALRMHVNVAYGTYSTRLNPCVQPRAINVSAPPGCPPGPVPFDPPCDRIPDVATLCGLPAAIAAQDTFDVTRSVGMRWMTGFGIDRAFALSSSLLSADVVAERFAGLFARTDVSAEVAVRQQLTPQLVIDVGIARHFNGLLRSNWLSVGLGYGMPVSRSRAP